MRTSQQIAVEWLPRLLSDEPKSTEFMQEVATELLKQCEDRERMQSKLERIRQAFN